MERFRRTFEVGDDVEVEEGHISGLEIWDSFLR